MTWVIASIPFWIVGALGLFTGTAVLVMATYRAARMEQEEFNHALVGGAIILIGSGGFLVLATKIAS